MSKSQKIDLYAPCDCDVAPIEKLNDGVFSEKMLGDGIYITPKENKFYSPIKEGSLEMIFETKHAYYLKQKNGPTVLMHIGLDTVGLKGEPFNVNAKVKSNVTLDSEIVDVNIDLIKQKNLDISTPIVVDQNDNKGWTLKWNNVTSAKRGEKIAELIFDQPDIIKEDKLTLEYAMKNGLDFRGKYEKIADRIYSAVGGKENYARYYNCTTRLRFIIKNQNIVNEKAIKEIMEIKGIHWADNELQIIVGGEVTKIREGLDEYIERLNSANSADFALNQKGAKKQVPFLTRLLNSVKGMILPAIPALIGLGILGGVKAILQITHVIDVVSPNGNMSDYTTLSILIYIIFGSATMFIGIFFCHNAVKYFGGSSAMGILLGLMLTAPLLYRGNISELAPGSHMFTTSAWSLNLLKDNTGYVWMKIATEPGSLIMAGLAGYTLVQFEKPLKKHIPNWGQMIFVPTFALFGVGMVSLFVYSPIVTLLEAVLGWLVDKVSTLPFGLSVAMFALFWQFLVVTGAHMALTMIIYLPVMNNPTPYITGLIPITILAGKMFATFGQIASSFAVGLTTKNKNISSVVVGAIPAGVFGITEPMMFGVNIPKGMPFIWGCIAAGLGGMVAGPMGATFYLSGGGGGVLSLINATGPNRDIQSLIASIVGLIVTMGSGILLTVFFSKDRKAESKGLNIANKQLIKLFTKNNIPVSPELTSEMNVLASSYTKEIEKRIKDWEKINSKYQNFALKISVINAREDEYKKGLSKKFNKIKLKGNTELLAKIIEKMNTTKFDDQRKPILEKLNSLEVQNNADETWVEEITQKNEILAKEIVKLAHKAIDSESVEKYYGWYYNAINSCLINFELRDRMDPTLTKVEKKQLYALHT